ncbi:MAG: hypothetical protein ACR2N4_00060 [Jatrophihabitans sp.]
MGKQTSRPAPDPEWQLSIVARLQRGEAIALMELYDRTAPKVFGHALKLAQDPTEALSATRHAFVEVWKAPILLSDPRVPPTIALATIAATKITRHARRRTATGNPACPPPA